MSIYVDLKDMAVMRDTLRAKEFQLETALSAVPKVLYARYQYVLAILISELCHTTF